MIIALVAAACMVVTDVLATLLTLAQTRGHGRIAGALDVSAWYVSIFTTSISVSTLGGHDLTKKIYVLTFVGIANYVGTVTGETLGQRWFRTDTEQAIAAAARSGR